MDERKNKFGQPIGPEVDGWSGATRPKREPLAGSYCRLEPLSVAAHLESLHNALSEDVEGKLWTYMSGGPYQSLAEVEAWMWAICALDDPLYFAIVDIPTGRAMGVAALMRINPDAGVIEVGSITYSPGLQRTAAATEAMFLLMRQALAELGYRRYEWKCDALNEPSRKAAARLGFTYEGLFRQALVYKGRNRDTAWFSILDSEWPALEKAYLQWLAPANFDEAGMQKKRLQNFIDPA